MGPGEVLARAEALGKDRDRLEGLLDMGVERLRDVLVYRTTLNEAFLVYGHGTDRQWGAQVPLQRLLADMELFTTSRGLLDRRVSAQLVAENLLLELGR